MKIKNVEIEQFINFLLSFELAGKDSRLRTRFVRMLMDRQRLIDQEHLDLIKEYANLDENNIPKVIDVNGVKMYDMRDTIAFNREYHILLSEEFIVEENEERKELLLFIKSLILDCDKVFKDNEALEFDRWCEIVEEIEYK